MSSVVVVDYGLGNLLSVTRALEHCEASVEVTADPDRVRKACRLVLPGVGAFADCVKELSVKGLDEAVRDFGSTGRPLLGICVGMQVLFSRGLEFGDNPGLGLLSGEVVEISRLKADGSSRKIPHVGWASLNCSSDKAPLVENVAKDSAAYFVHSFQAEPTNVDIIVATADYEELTICAAVSDENILGCQFHPEKSGRAGLRILKNFLCI
ncbi:MAG: imidazole glycerol phosphate synthase subunit HisH [Burkholderiales bacterium]|nr:imidazole glycerol phosphate synthase subunit HisH [Burkholderiales bacterium]